MITITLQQIRDAEPCVSGWRKVLDANGNDLNKPFKVSSILDSNDLNDCLWTLRCLPEHNDLWRKFACWCALENIELIKPYCTDADYSLILDYLNNPDYATDVANTAVCAVCGIRAVRADRAAYAASRAAAYAATDFANDFANDTDFAYAAISASRAATSASAYAANCDTSRAVVTERKKQADKLREILDAGEWVV